MKILITENKWLAPGRAVSAGEVREDLSEDEVKLVRAMQAGTTDKAMIAQAEQTIADKKASARERATVSDKTEKAVKT